MISAIRKQALSIDFLNEWLKKRFIRQTKRGVNIDEGCFRRSKLINIVCRNITTIFIPAILARNKYEPLTRRVSVVDWYRIIIACVHTHNRTHEQVRVHDGRNNENRIASTV